MTDAAASQPSRRAALACLIKGHRLATTPWLLASTGVIHPWARPGRGLLCLRCNVVVRIYENAEGTS